MLLEAGADVHAELYEALSGAAGGGHVEAMKVLLEAGAKVNAEGGSMSPLHLAAAEGHVEAVKLLLEAGADVNDRSNWDEWTPLHVAVYYGVMSR